MHIWQPECHVCIENADVANKIFYLAFFKCHISILIIFLKSHIRKFKQK